jgi:GT2 family glycosyltransferase
LVSIVIPTRNGADLLRTCLDSLRETRYQAFEVVVVDNGSDDPVALELMAERESVGEIRVLRDPSPFNYSALNNRAVTQACRGEFVVLMNNDIEITHPEWLAEMVGMALEPGVGCVGARLWYPDGRLQHGGVIMVCGVAGHAHKYLPRGHHGYMGRAVLAQDFLAVTAACLLVRREVFNEVGGLDESLKVAFNDVDFCLRVHAAGYRNVWTPFAQMIHHESVTRGHEDTPEKQQRFAGEIAILQTRWPDLLAHDPCYSPNLTNQAEDFSFAWPPRRKMP